MTKTTTSRLVLFGKSVLMVSAAAVMLVACKKGDTGPAGPAGPAGPSGPTGSTGSANVIYSAWMTPESQGGWRDTTHNSKRARYFSRESAAFTQDVIDKAVVLCYVNVPSLGSETYQLPVIFPAVSLPGGGGWASAGYRQALVPGKISFYLFSPDGNVDVPLPNADNSNKFRYIIIPGSVQAGSAAPYAGGHLPSARTVEQLQRMSYNEIKALYNIPENASNE